MARRIALVEDDPTIRQNYADALKRAGYEVAAFADRPSASRSFATRLPDLAIVDVGLGDEIDGGFTLCRELRGASARRSSSFPRATPTSTSCRDCASGPTTT